MVTKERISEGQTATQAECPAGEANENSKQRPPIGQLLRTLRGTKTLRQVEADTGITNAYLSNLESGLSPNPPRGRAPAVEGRLRSGGDGQGRVDLD